MTSAHSLNEQLVAALKQQNLIQSREVERAFLATPRHLFAPDVSLDEAYADRAITTKTQNGIIVSSISQPAIVAIMLEQLRLRAGMNVLEIGAGTGYNAALMAQITGRRGRVTTVDIDEDIADGARAHLQAAGVDNVAVRCHDGGLGDASHAPYDRIILTVGAWDISPAWLEQLKPGGIIVLPLLLGVRQFSIAFAKAGDHLRSQGLKLCGFTVLRGSFAGPAVIVLLGDFILGGEFVERIAREQLRALLQETPRERQAREDILLTDLLDYMALKDETVFSLFPVTSASSLTFSYGVCAPTMDSVVLMPVTNSQQWEPSHQAQVFGTDRAWDTLAMYAEQFTMQGKPSIARGAVEAYPVGHAPSDGIRIRKRWMEYVIKPG